MPRTAGEFSAISALFGGPLVASFMLIESGVALGAAPILALPSRACLRSTPRPR
ncbi:hypothetical protein ACI782_14390 [Geodermatophilus sp. SYSU D00703]